MKTVGPKVTRSLGWPVEERAVRRQKMKHNVWLRARYTNRYSFLCGLSRYGGSITKLACHDRCGPWSTRQGPERCDWKCARPR